MSKITKAELMKEQGYTFTVMECPEQICTCNEDKSKPLYPTGVEIDEDIQDNEDEALYPIGGPGKEINPGKRKKNQSKSKPKPKPKQNDNGPQPLYPTGHPLNKK